jgi:adenylate kinase family enzyme
VKRICIIGSPGSGKSTLAKHLGHLLKLKVIHLDTLFWQPGWVSVSDEELMLKQGKYIQEEHWIIDGSYSSIWTPRIERAGTIIFMDFSRWICLYRIMKRYVKYRNQTRSDMGQGCPERIDLEFLTFVWNYPANRRFKVLNIIKRYAEEKQIFIFQNQQQVTSFLEKVKKGNSINIESPT